MGRVESHEAGFPPLYVAFRGVTIGYVSAERPFPPEASVAEPDAKIGRRPSLFMLWRIGGLWSLHVQGQQKEEARGRGQGRLLKPILVPKEVYEQADHFSW
jgi:hypothetical protein